MPGLLGRSGGRQSAQAHRPSAPSPAEPLHIAMSNAITSLANITIKPVPSRSLLRELCQVHVQSMPIAR